MEEHFIFKIPPGTEHILIWTSFCKVALGWRQTRALRPIGRRVPRHLDRAADHKAGPIDALNRRLDLGPSVSILTRDEALISSNIMP